jgi:hypothetical protein
VGLTDWTARFFSVARAVDRIVNNPVDLSFANQTTADSVALD